TQRARPQGPEPLLHQGQGRDGRRDTRRVRGARALERRGAALGQGADHRRGYVLQEDTGPGLQRDRGLPSGPAADDVRDARALGHPAAATSSRGQHPAQLRRVPGLTARSGARLYRVVAALRDVRPGRHRRALYRHAPPDTPADHLRLRRLPRRRRHLRARLRDFRGGHPRYSGRTCPLPVQKGLPGVRPVPQVRQLERAVEQGRGGQGIALLTRAGEPLPDAI
ncbi:MAG: ATP-dependent RNA helicase, DEAD/DEAH box family, partial [uncultured Rubrobacteraceae bacterium]